MIHINHQQQQIDGVNWTCGAVCLSMIFDFFGIQKDVQSIWDEIKTARNGSVSEKFSTTMNLVNFSMQNGLNATVYRTSGSQFYDLLDYLTDASTPAILSMLDNKSKRSHFQIFVGKKNGDFAFENPMKSNGIEVLKYERLRDLWSPHPEDSVTGYIFILFSIDNCLNIKCPNCQTRIPIVNSEIITMNLVEGVACPQEKCSQYLRRESLEKMMADSEIL